MVALKQLLSWSNYGALILCVASCVGGKSASDTIRQNSVVISDSTEFPYNLQHMNKYFLEISNHTATEINLVDKSLTLSSLGATELGNLLDLSSCNKIAANGNCRLTIILPESNQQNGYFAFKLNYTTTNENNTYEINKLIKYSAGGFESKEITFIGESKETIIQNAGKFTLAVPFVLNKNFKNIGLELNGQAISSVNHLLCAKADFSAGNSCTALVELQRGVTAQQIKINTTDEKGNLGSVRADFIYQYNNAAHLTYLNSPLFYPTSNAKSDEAVVFNDGTAAANNLQFSLVARNSADDANTVYDVSSKCGDTQFLDPGTSCLLVYKNNATPSTVASWITQKITYENGITGAAPIIDNFIIYRILQNYVRIKQTNLPLVADGSAFSVEATLIGDGNVTVSGAKIVTGNPFGHTQVLGTCSLSANAKTCNLNLKPNGGMLPTNLTGFEVGAVELVATTSGKDAFSIENPNVFYRVAAKETIKLDSNIPSAYSIGDNVTGGYYIDAKLTANAPYDVLITATPNDNNTTITTPKCTILKGKKSCRISDIVLSQTSGSYSIDISSNSNIYTSDAGTKIEYQTAMSLKDLKSILNSQLSIKSVNSNQDCLWPGCIYTAVPEIKMDGITPAQFAELNPNILIKGVSMSHVRHKWWQNETKRNKHPGCRQAEQVSLTLTAAETYGFIRGYTDDRYGFYIGWPDDENANTDHDVGFFVYLCNKAGDCAYKYFNQDYKGSGSRAKLERAMLVAEGDTREGVVCLPSREETAKLKIRLVSSVVNAYTFNASSNAPNGFYEVIPMSR